jgi:ubiquinone/menaquinone biosynthesis C-methylase UbiE
VSGAVLEVAVGTGKNLTCYPQGCRITAIDVSGMLNVASARAAKISMHVSFSLADAETLPFPDHSFDTVVSSRQHLHIPNPARVFERWRTFVERAVRSCYWSTAEAITSGWDIGRTGMQIIRRAAGLPLEPRAIRAYRTGGLESC